MTAKYTLNNVFSTQKYVLYNFVHIPNWFSFNLGIWFCNSEKNTYTIQCSVRTDSKIIIVTALLLCRPKLLYAEYIL